MIGWLAGCAARVPITSTPASAELTIGEGDAVTLATTPATVEVGWRCVPVVATAPGRRSVAIDVCRRDRRGLELALVTEHGAVGTWSASDVP